ncbi:MAG: hypothetical protein WDW38_009810 [Sanguina aurantia]
MERATVDLVRVPREERYFDREEVLGRDVTSVFSKPAPRKAAVHDSDGAGGPSSTPLADAEALKQSLGARRFISETELDEVRASRGKGSVEDGAVAVDKPLVEVLREAKAAKEADFASKWKTMKTGKNRPLDPEELDFLDGMLQQERDRDRQWSQQQKEELYAFRQHAAPGEQMSSSPLTGAGAVAAVAVQEKDTAEDAAAAAESLDPFSPSSTAAPPSSTIGPEPPPKAVSKRPAAAPMVRPLVTIKRKAVAPPAAPRSGGVVAAVSATHPNTSNPSSEARTESKPRVDEPGVVGTGSCRGPTESREAEEGPCKTALQVEGAGTDTPGLGGLFAGYGSDSDEEGKG